MNGLEMGVNPRRWGYSLGAGAIAGYFLLMVLFGGLGWQHLGLLLFFWACLSRLDTPRRFIRDWWPIVVFWLAYDAMRVAGPVLYPRVYVEDPFRWEQALFLSPEGIIWPYYFTHWLEKVQGSLWAGLLSQYSNVIYLSHVFAFPIILFVIWMRRSDLLFRRLLWSFSALHVMALCLYWGYPAAPPWWVFENGFVRPSVGHSTPLGYQEGTVLAGIFHFSANKFAAIPSLHGAYPVLLAMVFSLQGLGSRWIMLTAFYAASMWFACVFLNQHYLVDLLIGAVLAAVALPFALIPKEKLELRA